MKGHFLFFFPRCRTDGLEKLLPRSCEQTPAQPPKYFLIEANIMPTVMLSPGRSLAGQRSDCYWPKGLKWTKTTLHSKEDLGVGKLHCTLSLFPGPREVRLFSHQFTRSYRAQNPDLTGQFLAGPEVINFYFWKQTDKSPPFTWIPVLPYSEFTLHIK